MGANEELLVTGIRAAGVFHLITLAAAWFTPIPADWDDNLRKLPAIHRRFAFAQNVFIGATIAFLGLICLFFATELVAATPLARMVCGGIALWWGGRLLVLPWLGVWPHLASMVLRAGFVLLAVECACYAVAFGFLAVCR